MSSNPEDYKHCNLQVNNDIEDIYGKIDSMISDDEFNTIEKILTSVNLETYNHFKDFEKDIRKYYCKSKPFNKSKILYVYQCLVESNTLKNTKFRKLLVKKPSKSQSGVLVITVLTSPYPIVNGKKQRFSCEWNCYYCPNEPGQPRSYLHDEPSVLRGNQNNFDPILQFTERAASLRQNGHPVDKVELLVLGGTWSSYPMQYREEFIRDLFYAANTIFIRNDKRERLDLLGEKEINSVSTCRIIGITLETRPDCINEEELFHFRRVGCTRVQLGIQHTDDKILDNVNRQCPTYKTKNAIKLLLNSSFKVDGHFMPQLPGATMEIDKKMFNNVLTDPDLQIDQWKIYPCEITPWTIIKKWYDEGKYTPYSDDELIQLLLWLKPKVHPWIRLNRIVRDIPNQYILGGLMNGNLRQVISEKMKKENLICKCIRCREIKVNAVIKPDDKLTIRKYLASGSNEYFISLESQDKNTIFGFLRLRLPNKNVKSIYKDLQNTALIRELHVYGQLVSECNVHGASQHTGIGKRLINEAEVIAFKNGYYKVSVIAGVGTREYYAKNKFKLLGIENGEMMIKPVYLPEIYYNILLRFIYVMFPVLFVIYMSIIHLKY